MIGKRSLREIDRSSDDRAGQEKAIRADGTGTRLSIGEHGSAEQRRSLNTHRVSPDATRFIPRQVSKGSK